MIQKRDNVMPASVSARKTLLSFMLKESRHIMRDRQTLVVLLALPVAMVLLFGFAVRTDVQNVRVAVVDPSYDAAGQSLVRTLDATPSLSVVRVSHSAGMLERDLRSDAVDVAVLLPSSFSRVLDGTDASVLIVTDGANPNYAQMTEAYVRTVVERWLLREGYGGGMVIQPVMRMRFNPTLESQYLLVPGLLAFVLALISALMTAISISREKERGNLEVLFVSPLRPTQIILGKVAPYLVLAFVNALSTLGVAWVVFRIPVRGSLTLLLAASLLYVLVSLAVGVLIAVRMPDQRTAMFGTLLGMLFPTLILSGFVFPIASLPTLLQPLSVVVPATYFIRIARGIMLKDVGLSVLWPDCLVLTLMAILLIAISARALRDRL